MFLELLLACDKISHSGAPFCCVRKQKIQLLQNVSRNVDRFLYFSTKKWDSVKGGFLKRIMFECST